MIDALDRGEGHKPSFAAASVRRLRTATGGKRGVSLLLGLLLLGFGAYQSVLYFGFHPVPNSDFCAFVKTGEELLSLHLPSSYKRAPVLCVLLVAISRLVGGAHPTLTAGWLLNGVLHPFNLLLFWLIGRKILGRAGIFVAIVAILNPVSLDMLSDPVVETTLLFFILLTLYLVAIRSRWAYALASVTTMVRYEGAALILVALVVDLIEHRNRRERLCALVSAALASLPLGLWMLGTIVSLRSGSGIGLHYLQLMGTASGGKFVIVDLLKVWSRVAFSPLLEFPPSGPGWAVEFVRRASQAFGLVALGVGTVLGVLRRDRNVLALSMFLGAYVLVHALYSFLDPRFCASVAGIALILAWYGVERAWETARGRLHIPPRARLVLRWSAYSATCLWLAGLFAALPSVTPMSERSASIPYVGVALVLVIALVRLREDGMGGAGAAVRAALAVSLAIASNQFSLVHVLGDGSRGAEYRVLAEWFQENARPGEGLACANTCAVELYAPKRKSDVTHFFFLTAGSPSEFVERCREKGIVYVAWDSDTGKSVGSYYYRLFHYENLEPLKRPRSSGPYEFVKEIDSEQGNHLYVFRIVKPPKSTVGR
jgi:hypothetical protein